MTHLIRTIAMALAALAVMALAEPFLPAWTVFLIVIALSKGIVVLGIVCLLRSGQLSFGQGLYYCAGAYAAGLLMLHGGVTDMAVLTVAGLACGVVIGLIAGPLLAGYRGIFFATLTLALSMFMYGALVKADALGGTDGLNIADPTFLGHIFASGADGLRGLYLFTAFVAVLAAAALSLHFGSVRGLLSLGARDNEIRVEYLGASVRRIVFENYVIAAGLGGVGGALSALAIGHIDPELTFWTTSGEFVFVAILAGYQGVGAALVVALALEFIRSFSVQYFPNAWQMSLGIFMLLVILFLPDGLGSIARRRRRVPKEASVETDS